MKPRPNPKADPRRLMPRIVRRWLSCRAPLRLRHRRDALLFCMLCALLAAMAGRARATPSQAPTLEFDQMSVRELMRLDSALALSQTKAKLQGQKDTQGSVVLGSEAKPRLQAIYGVGKKLAAEVRVGSATYVYMRGQPFPVGQRHADESLFVLRDISPSCVRLERQAQKLNLCLAAHSSSGR